MFGQTHADHNPISAQRPALIPDLIRGGDGASIAAPTGRLPVSEPAARRAFD